MGGSGDQPTRMLFLDEKNPFELFSSYHMAVAVSVSAYAKTDQTGVAMFMKTFSCNRG